MAKYSESVIEGIKRRISLVEVVSRYLVLHKKGDRYWGLCPFHEEKTPSFSVLPEKGFFHCFGCGKSGSLFDFIMEMEHLSFYEVVKLLAQQTGVQLEEETERDKVKRTETEALRELYEKLATSFHYILIESKSASNARNYLKKRGIPEEAWDSFRLGYAPDDPKWLHKFLIQKAYSPELLAKSGLFSRQHPEYPVFRNRLMFPIRDWQGRCIAFGGRDLSGVSQAKYMNTPETQIFSKREIVFGLFEGLEDIKKSGTCILCEGYFDVMALHISGLKTAVAPLGTAFTHEQGKLLRRYASTAITLFDADNAGKAATKKALVICESLGFENKVITIEGGKDPAEILESQGPHMLATACRQTRTGFDHLVYSAINMYDMQKPKGKLQIFNEVKPYIDSADSEIVRHGYLRTLAERLRIDEQTLMQEYRSGVSTQTEARNRLNRSNQEPPQAAREPWSRSVDLYAMVTLVNNRELFPMYRNKFKIEGFVDPQAMELFALLENAAREEVGATDEMILGMIGDDELKRLVAMSFQTKEFATQPEEILRECMHRITLRTLETRRKTVENLIRLAETDGAVAMEFSNLLMEKKALDDDIAKLRMPGHDGA